MKLSHRIFLGYFLVVAVAGFFLMKSIRDELRPAVRQSMEETLVDTANLLAEIAEPEVRETPNDMQSGAFAHAVEDFLTREPDARIWGLTKKRITNRIYITDSSGIVIYDSDAGKALGEDYSQWNDVYLTLQGKYGARSTRADPEDSNSSTMFVAAPIVSNDKIIGVLTIAKPSISIMPFIQLSQQNVLQAGIFLLLAALIMGWIFSQLLARSTRKLVRYAERVKQGEKAPLPRIPERELALLGDAMEDMRQALEGKEYVERYVHSLTHEIKSPLSGIRGASELLSEEMEKHDRQRFIENIREEAARIQIIVDRLLGLAQLEQQQELDRRQVIDMPTLVKETLAGHAARLETKSLQVKIDVEPSPALTGDPFLLRQSLDNLLINAMDFSPAGGSIHIHGRQENSHYILEVRDEGSGIPDYARQRLFERFYSLPRPDTGRKSSGLGLSFVREVMLLHGGTVEIGTAETGCTIRLALPLS